MNLSKEVANKIIIKTISKIILEDEEKLEEITNTLQSKFDQAISKHKL